LNVVPYWLGETCPLIHLGQPWLKNNVSLELRYARTTLKVLMSHSHSSGYTAFEMWWHTRRNQISSFGETDESI